MEVFKVKNEASIDMRERDWQKSLEREYCPDCDSYTCEHRVDFPRNNAKSVDRISPKELIIVTTENRTLKFICD